MTVDSEYHLNEGWYGSYYELAMQISATPEDRRLAAAVQRLWTAPLLVGGPWKDKESTASVCTPGIVEPEQMASTYGVLNVPGVGNVRCVSWVIRESGGGSDWLDVSIPTSALTRHGLAWPLVSETPRELIESIDGALVEIAAHVYAEVPFLLGLVGEEVSGMWSAADVTAADVAQGGFLLPERLAQRLDSVLPAGGVIPGLRWIPNRADERFDKRSER